MDDYGYGLWPLVVVNSLIFIIFAGSFFHPREYLLILGTRR